MVVLLDSNFIQLDICLLLGFVCVKLIFVVHNFCFSFALRKNSILPVDDILSIICYFCSPCGIPSFKFLWSPAALREFCIYV